MKIEKKIHNRKKIEISMISEGFPNKKLNFNELNKFIDFELIFFVYCDGSKYKDIIAPRVKLKIIAFLLL